MARRSAPPPKPKSPILTVGQKRRRIERLQKCVTSLEAFDPQKARKRAPAVLALEAAIDKALSSAFGYGTAAYLRYNQAATLDLSPLLTNVTLRAPVLRPVGGPAGHHAKAQDARPTTKIDRVDQLKDVAIAAVGPLRSSSDHVGIQAAALSPGRWGPRGPVRTPPKIR
jgi:hypothetical protein